VEVIVTIIAAGILGAFFIQFMGTAMSRSALAVENVRVEASAEALMEQIVADYVAEINKSNPSSALATIKAKSYGSGVTMEYINFNASGERRLPVRAGRLKSRCRPPETTSSPF